MKPWYATNGRALLDSRKRGTLPNGPVAVRLIPGEQPGAALTLHVHDDMPADRLDWRMLVNLDVWLCADATIPMPTVQRHLDRIARARPHTLVLRFAHLYRYSFEHAGEVHQRQIDVHDIEIGIGKHHAAMPGVLETHEFMWCPTNNAATPLGAKLRRALLAQHPAFTVL